MKNLLLLFVFFFLGVFTLHAQKVYFIYLQTDNQQPFYARMGEKTYNSNPSGYLILSNLRDSNYSINIGLQGSQAPDQPYSITVNRKDQGFLLKNFGDKGWGLFNMATMSTIMPSATTVKSVQTVKTEKREDNAFTNLLAKAADDSTIKERPVIEKPVEKKPDPVVVTVEKNDEIKENITAEENRKDEMSTEKKDEPKVDSTALIKQIEEESRMAKLKADSILAARERQAELLRQEELKKQDSVLNTKAENAMGSDYKRSTVKLKSESSTTTGIGLVFLDMVSDQVTDTIRLLIPPDSRKTKPTETKPGEMKFLDISSADSVQKDETGKSEIKNNCKLVADDDDFLKLRKNMAGETSDNGMIAEALKDFRTRCFSTVQIRNLSTLFLSDEFKYRFFDAAYQFVSDPGNYASLQSELRDEYYINRFKAMLRF